MRGVTTNTRLPGEAAHELRPSSGSPRPPGAWKALLVPPPTEEARAEPLLQKQRWRPGWVEPSLRKGPPLPPSSCLGLPPPEAGLSVSAALQGPMRTMPPRVGALGGFLGQRSHVWPPGLG